MNSSKDIENLIQHTKTYTILLSGTASLNHSAFNENASDIAEQFSKISAMNPGMVKLIGLVNNQSLQGTKSELNISLIEAIVGNSTATHPNVLLSGTEEGIREGLSFTFQKYGNKHAKFISAQTLGLGLGVNGFTHSENIEWLKANHIDLLILYHPNITLDYTSRLYDIGFLNIVYSLTILDFWWYDGIGTWFLENNSNIKLIEINSGKVHSVEVKGARTSIGYMKINNAPSSAFRDAYSNTVRTSFQEL